MLGDGCCALAKRSFFIAKLPHRVFYYKSIVSSNTRRKITVSSFSNPKQKSPVKKKPYVFDFMHMQNKFKKPNHWAKVQEL